MGPNLLRVNDFPQSPDVTGFAPPTDDSALTCLNRTPLNPNTQRPAMKTQPITFPGAHGQTLAARLELPDTTPRAYALFAHCFTCGKNSRAATTVSRALAASGVAVLRFDFTGLGGSDGDFENTNFSSNVDDIVAAADYLRASYAAPELLIGHSLGGAAILAAAHRIDEARAIATIGAPADVEHIANVFAADIETIEEEGAATVDLAGRPFTVQRQFLDDIRAQPQQQRIANIDRPLLILHAPADNTVGIDNASQIFMTARHPKSFISLDNADHLLTNKADGRFAATVIAAWADRYLTPAATPEQTEGVVTVEETGYHKFQNNISAGGAAFLADEPAKVGGGGTGPTPYDLLAASLGACKSMTMRMYADHKKLPLERVRVEVTHDKIHAKDCEDCETKTARIDEFRVAIHLTGKLDDAQRQRIIEIAERCPVQATLQNDVRIRTLTADD